jgi:hypothetical protein
MSKTIQIRDAPDYLRQRLKAREAEKGMRLSDYLKQELARIVEQPTLDERLDRLGKESPPR